MILINEAYKCGIRIELIEAYELIVLNLSTINNVLSAIISFLIMGSF